MEKEIVSEKIGERAWDECEVGDVLMFGWGAGRIVKKYDRIHTEQWRENYLYVDVVPLVDEAGR